MWIGLHDDLPRQFSLGVSGQELRWSASARKEDGSGHFQESRMRRIYGFGWPEPFCGIIHRYITFQQKTSWASLHEGKNKKRIEKAFCPAMQAKKCFDGLEHGSYVNKSNTCLRTSGNSIFSDFGD